MNRSTLARTGGPIAVFAVVLGVLVAISTRGGGGDDELRPLPIAAAGGRAAGSETRTTSDARMPAYYGAALTFRPGVTDGLPKEGPVYTLGRDLPTERVEALAKALGVTGEIRKVEEGWEVGSGDRVLRVSRMAGLPWYLDGYSKDGEHKAGTGGVVVAEPAKPMVAPSTPPPSVTHPCPPDAPCAASKPTAQPEPDPGSGQEPGVATEPARPDPATVPTPLPQPSDEAALRAARPVIEAAGVTGDVTYADGWDAKEIVVTPDVGGLPTSGRETRVAVDIDGKVLRANGHLGAVTYDARYPLLDPAAAATRGRGDVPANAEPGNPEPAMDTPCVAPCEPVPPTPQEVVKVRLGLTMAPTFDDSGEAFLVPAWLVTISGGTYELPLMALPDRYLATPPPPEDPDSPVCSPAPCPPPPSDRPVDGGGQGSSPGSAGSGSTGSTGSDGQPPPDTIQTAPAVPEGG